MHFLDTTGYTFLLLQLYFLSTPKTSISKLLKPNKLGFLCGIVGSTLITLFGFQIYSIPTIAMNSMAIGLNLRGLKND